MKYFIEDDADLDNFDDFDGAKLTSVSTTLNQWESETPATLLKITGAIDNVTNSPKLEGGFAINIKLEGIE